MRTCEPKRERNQKDFDLTGMNVAKTFDLPAMNLAKTFDLTAMNLAKTCDPTAMNLAKTSDRRGETPAGIWELADGHPGCAGTSF